MWKILLLLGASLLSSCSGLGYNREWKKALAAPRTGLTGCWEGRWVSEGNGHNGKLRCIVTPSDPKKEEFQFHYHAEWGKLFRGAFSITCQAQPQKDGSWKVSGAKDLGKLFGGVFHHDAKITPEAMRATYSAALDHGRMELARPGPAAPSGSATR